jgi:TPR repeat protein
MRRPFRFSRLLLFTSCVSILLANHSASAEPNDLSLIPREKYPANLHLFKVPELKNLVGQPLKDAFLYGDFWVSETAPGTTVLQPYFLYNIFGQQITDPNVVRQQMNSDHLGSTRVLLDTGTSPIPLQSKNPIHISRESPLELRKVSKSQTGNIVAQVAFRSSSRNAPARENVTLPVAGSLASAPTQHVDAGVATPSGARAKDSRTAGSGASISEQTAQSRSPAAIVDPSPQANAALKAEEQAVRQIGLTQVLRAGASPSSRQAAAEQVLAWLASAQHGDAAAQQRLGQAIHDGYGVGKDLIQAVEWWRKSAQQNEPKAQYSLGAAYLIGEGVARDILAGVSWLRKSAEQGNSSAQVLLAVLYARGDGVERNGAEAYEWARKSAEQGDPEGQLCLGWAWHAGTGGKRNDTEAVKWYRLSAEQNHPPGQLALGDAYLTGTGVEKNEKEGVTWIRKSANQGWTIAQQVLGTLQAGENVGPTSPRTPNAVAFSKSEWRKSFARAFPEIAEQMKAVELAGAFNSRIAGMYGQGLGWAIEKPEQLYAAVGQPDSRMTRDQVLILVFKCNDGAIAVSCNATISAANGGLWVQKIDDLPEGPRLANPAADHGSVGAPQAAENVGPTAPKATAPAPNARKAGARSKAEWRKSFARAFPEIAEQMKDVELAGAFNPRIAGMYGRGLGWAVEKPEQLYAAVGQPDSRTTRDQLLILVFKCNDGAIAVSCNAAISAANGGLWVQKIEDL